MIFGDMNIIEVILGVLIGLWVAVFLIGFIWVVFAINRELDELALAHKERMEAHEYYMNILEELLKEQGR